MFYLYMRRQNMKITKIIIFFLIFQAADIWSLGVTLYTLVFGKVPFHDENILALYNKIRTQDLEFPDNHQEVSPELMDLIQKMLVKDASERIKLSEIKQHDWVSIWVAFVLLFDLLQKTINFKPFFAINDKNPTVKNPQNCIFDNQFC